MTCEVCASAWPSSLEGFIGWMHFHGPPCWFLVREIYRRHLGITLPFDNVLEPQERWRALVQAGLVEWHSVEEGNEQPYDGVLLRTEHVDHIGLVIAPGRFLHVPRPEAGACAHPFARYREHGQRLRVYRHRLCWSPTHGVTRSSISIS